MISIKSKKKSSNSYRYVIGMYNVHAICAEDIFGLHNDGIQLCIANSLEIFSCSHDLTTNSK